MEKKQFRKMIEGKKQQNVIILTEFGVDKIRNQSEWREKNNTIYNSINKSRTALGSTSNNTGKQAQSTGNLKERVGRNIEGYSKKILKRHQLWNSLRDNIENEICRQQDKVNIQKDKQFVWMDKISQPKRQINEILQSWQNSSIQESKRTLVRLHQIYAKKYRLKKGREKQKSVNYQERPFFIPRKSNIHYSNNMKSETFIERPNFKKMMSTSANIGDGNMSKIYFKIVHPRRGSQNF